MAPKVNRREFLVASGTTAGLAALTPKPLQGATSNARVAGLKVDYLERPLGLENDRPRFSWRLESSVRNVRQSAYRILVASSEEKLLRESGDLWDSQKVVSRKSIGIRYEGRALVSRQHCCWRVQVWDETDRSSDWSQASGWEMGFLRPEDWNAGWLAVEDGKSKEDREAGLHWIWGSTPLDARSRKFRLEVNLNTPARDAILFVGGRDTVNSVWLDGRSLPIAARKENAATHEALNAISIGTLDRGRHVLAVEVGRSSNKYDKQLSAMTALLRVEFGDQAALRIPAGPEWKTSLTTDADWMSMSYRDMNWEAARASVVEPSEPWPAAPAMHLRRPFQVAKQIVLARLYATALGAYEARLNGQRVGDARLTPEVAQYRKRVLYRVYDVTQMLRTGDNVLGLTVGDGWYASASTFTDRYPWGPAPRRAIAQLEVTLEDGTRQTVATGPGWRIAPSAITRSEIYNGEIVDARLDQPGWDAPGFDDSHWMVADVAEKPACRLVAQVSPPIRITQILKPAKITAPLPDTYVFDFGQNFAGWARLHVKGPSGRYIELRFAEILGPTGEVDQANLRSALATDAVTLRGDRNGEIFEPKFTYHGFRYVQVTGLPSAPAADSLLGVVAHSELGMTGKLRIEHPLVDKIWHNTFWSQRSNFFGVYTDCPQRDERLGWMGDAGLLWDTAAFNMDIDAFTHRHMANVRDEQTENGNFLIIAPAPFTRLSRGGQAWSDAGVILPWTVWQRYADLRIIEDNWEAMNRFVQYIADNSRDYLRVNKSGVDYDMADWLSVDAPAADANAPTTPPQLIGTAYWAHSVNLLAQMAEAIGRTDDADRLRRLHANIKGAFARAYVKADGSVGNESHTSYILALEFDLVPAALRQAAAERLATDVRRRGVMLSSGILGFQFGCDVLADAGYADLAYGLLLRTEYPSLGYMIGKGATTIWERWNGDTGDLAMNSYNHPDFGAICGFLFRRVAGIDSATPGFETVVVRPVLDRRVKRGGGDYDSIMGKISTDWSLADDGSFSLRLDIPANTSARVHLPARRDSRIEEGRRGISRRSDVHITGRFDREAVVEVGSGTYRFEVSA